MRHLTLTIFFAFVAKGWPTSGAVNMLEASLVLLVALIKDCDGGAIRHADDFARELKGGGGERVTQTQG